ncbi:MAG: hypothetical protein JSS24_10015 [Proteobacteria bacterium]|nr:hypothetical protein [Pseudomonadota bacterium]
MGADHRDACFFGELGQMAFIGYLDAQGIVSFIAGDRMLYPIGLDAIGWLAGLAAVLTIRELKDIIGAPGLGLLRIGPPGTVERAGGDSGRCKTQTGEQTQEGQFHGNDLV